MLRRRQSPVSSAGPAVRPGGSRCVSRRVMVMSIATCQCHWCCAADEAAPSERDSIASPLTRHLPPTDNTARGSSYQRLKRNDLSYRPEDEAQLRLEHQRASHDTGGKPQL